MNTKLAFLTVTAVAIALVPRLHSQGYIVPSGVTYAGFDGLGYGINVVHNPASPTNGGSVTGFDLDPIGKTPPTAPFVNTFQFDPIVDIGVRVFLVSPNDPISLQPILSMNYTELTVPNSYIFSPGVPFYVGLYTGNQSYAPPNGFYSDPLFGWAELENVNGTIELLNSKLEYQGGGIYAGTQNVIPIPEPGMLGLFCVGGLLFGLYRVRRK